MKICIVNSFYYPNIVGGAEISVLKLAEELFKCGNEVYIITTGDKRQIEVINGVEVHRLKIKNFYSQLDMYYKYDKLNKIKRKMHYIIDNCNIFNYKLINNELELIKPDIIHINNIHGFSSIIWNVTFRNKIPTIQTLRDYSLLKNEKNLKNKIKKYLYCYLGKNIDVITAPSKYTLNEFKKNKYFLDSKMRVVYNAIDFSKKEIKEVLKEKKNRKENKNIKFLFLGRLEKEKGINFLMDSFLNVENKDIELIIAGDGTKKNEVLENCKRDYRIKYVGFLDEIEKQKMLKECDILIIPSLWAEPFGRVIIEGYKYAMPVIGTRVGGIPEVIINESTGKLVEPNNKVALEKCIEYFSNRENVLNYIERSSDEIEKYNIENHAIEYYKLYEFMLDNHNI